MLSETPELLHVRVVFSLIMGLAITTLLKGIVSFVQHPRRLPVSLIHLGWALWALITCIAVWWWEFELSRVGVWTFESYAFELVYCSSYFVLASLLFPEDVEEYGGFENYFVSRRRWILGVVGFNSFIDTGDTILKGEDYLHRLGFAYTIHLGVMLVACILGAVAKNLKVQRLLAALALAYQIAYIALQYSTLAR